MANSLPPHDCSPPVSSVRRIFQARILEWVAIPFCTQLHEWLLLGVNSSWHGPHTFPRQLGLTREELLGHHVLSFDTLVLNKTFTLANLFFISCWFFFFLFELSEPRKWGSVDISELPFSPFKNIYMGNSLVVQWLGLSASLLWPRINPCSEN